MDSIPQAAFRARPPIAYRIPSLTVMGNAMAPDLRQGARIYYLPTDTLGEDGLYVFMLDKALKVCYIQQLSGGRIRLIPRNPLYERETLVQVGDDAPGLYRSEASGGASRFRLIGIVLPGSRGHNSAKG